MGGSEGADESAGSMESQRSSARNVYLLVTPLSCYHKYSLQRLDVSRRRCPNKRVPFKRLQHWAVQVGDDHEGETYEVTSFYRNDHIPELKMSSADKWRETRHKHIGYARKMFITVTTLSTQELSNIAKALWDIVLEDSYRAFSRNCQSFAELFQAIIQSHHLLTEEDHMAVQDLPSSFNPLYVFMHLTQAHVITARWTRKVLGKEEKHSSAVPSKRSGRWLDLVNEAAKNHQFHDTADIRAIIQEANRLRKEDKNPVQKAKRSASAEF